MSGGEKIAIEFSRRWTCKANISLFTSNLGVYIWNRYNMNKIRKIEFMKLSENSSVFTYFYRTMVGCFKLGLKNLNQDYKNIIYSASDFWPDTIPAFIMKLKNRNAQWIAGFYMFAPTPWQKDSPYKGKRWFIGLFYWLTQLPVYWLIKKYADVVFITSTPDLEKFITKRRNKDEIMVIRGGVDIKPSLEYLSSGNIISLEKKEYDACFVGRFHPQKGVLVLIDIWKLVCKKMPNAKMIMIGAGPLEGELIEKIERLELLNNIELLGFKDGEEKYKIFKQSKIVVHPATYDSGGMAACEAMAWGLPGVGFDLEALKTYYPKGMLKTPCYDVVKFSENITRLLENKELYKKTSEDAIVWAREWDWDKNAKDILQQVERICL